MRADHRLSVSARRCIILTSADSTIANAAREIGAAAFIAKPFDLPQLLQLLGQVSSSTE